jgi:hypothetical protein
MRRFVWVQSHWTAKEENNEQETRRMEEEGCLPERISIFLLLPQRLRASCSIVFPL